MVLGFTEDEYVGEVFGIILYIFGVSWGIFIFAVVVVASVRAWYGSFFESL